MEEIETNRLRLPRVEQRYSYLASKFETKIYSNKISIIPKGKRRNDLIMFQTKSNCVAPNRTPYWENCPDSNKDREWRPPLL
jgi:hypothetical protein